ncbi:MAG: uracil-DNA glycosylase [Silicimonas sp.]|nr:uracil-DNA glycosylase [Silicimonas sp.]
MADLPEGLGAWADLPFFETHWPGIRRAVADDTRQILPPEDQRFAALTLCQPGDCRVVILGQDPYPTPGHAMGLAFSVTPGTALPKSLKNIYAEMKDDIRAAPANGDLTHWATSGVLLLNTALSVPAGDAGGHAKLGWQRLTEEVLAHLSDSPRAFLLWGKHAQKLKSHITGSDHLILEAPHPSPLSAYRGFFGSRPFSQINAWLEARNARPIPWAQP